MSAKIQWVTKKVAVSDLKPYERNPRRISEEAFANLKRSLQEDGYHQRIIANADLSVIGGHQRIKALTELGIKDVEVLVPNQQLDEQTFRRILIRDNLQAGEWDFDALANDFDAEELKDWGFPESLLPSTEDDEAEGSGDGEGGEGDNPGEVMLGIVISFKTDADREAGLIELREQGYLAYLAQGTVKVK